MDIKFNSDTKFFWIEFNAIIYLLIKKSKFLGFQSWIEGDNHFAIEIYLEDHEPVVAEFDNREKWAAVLNALKQNIRQI